MKRRSLFFIYVTVILFAFTQSAFSAIFYVSLSGSDTNNGMAINTPFATVYKAVQMANPGDLIYVRGGTYICATRINLSKSGTATQMNFLFAYPGERVTFNFSSMVVADSNQGIQISGDYWYVKGIAVFNAGDNGMLIQGGNYNRIENCEFYENRDAGFQIKGTGAYNKIINCDAYDNADPQNSYGNADGFSTKIDPGDGNYYYGCRAWCNSDDGWDGYLKTNDVAGGYPSPDNVTTTLENCWVFKSGYLKGGTSTCAGNGNGFKTGGSDNKDQRHNQVLINCLSFGNKNKGFDQNNNAGSVTIINGTSISNASGNYMFKTALATGKVVTLKNCISYQPSGTKCGVMATAVLATNSFVMKTDASEQSNVSTAADFQTADVATGYTQCTGARKPNGSLPDVTFAHLATTSANMIDKGTVISDIPYLGITPVPFNGTKPDLGCFETGTGILTPTYNIAVNTTGSGTVTLDPATGPYIKGSVVTLIANANAGYKFTDFSGGITATSKIATIVMDGDKTVSANFVSTAQYTLTVNVVGSGSVLLNPVNPGVYDAGTVVSLNAIANAGNLFMNYGGDLSSDTNSSTVTMDGNKTITATFTPIVAADWNTIQAESGILVSATSKTDHAYTGTGYIDFTNGSTDASVTLNVTVTTAGCYDVNIFYAGIEDRPMNVYVNGVLWANPSCPNPGSYDVYAYAPVVISLKAGSNAIKFTGPGANGGPNFDRIEIKKVPRTGNCSPASPTALVPVTDLIQNLVMTPNPVEQITTMTFKSVNNETGKLSVFTLTGKLMFEESYNFNIGANQKNIDLSLLNSGMYIGRLMVGEQSQSIKIMKK